VPRFTPFPALRYRADLVAEAIAPPYDVLSDADVDSLRARSPHNVVRVDVPRPSDGDEPYELAAQTLREWIADGVLERDDRPSFTIYRLRFVDASGAARDIVGVLGGLEVVDPGAGGVLPHERVTPKASTDRLDLTRATNANLSPIWGLSLASGLSALLQEPGEPVGAVTVDGVEHVVERVSDPARVAAIAVAVASDDVLIADGHHRYGVAQTYRDEARRHGDAAAAEDTLAFLSELTGEQLSVEAIHRLYSDVSVEELTDALGGRFEIEPAPGADASLLAEMDRRGALVLVTGDGASWLVPRPGAFDGVRAIDGAWLETALDGLEHSVTYQHGVDLVAEAVATGQATAAVLIRPVSVPEIERTAREGALMPPKSTFFTPKLRTGFVIRELG
jgi:uncharacterized protein (DUF1015 family)